jgi:hypothetical protein
MAKKKTITAPARTSKPIKSAKTQDGVIGPKNPQNYGRGKGRK